MYCAECNYLLFNLTRPVCPECGASFKVTDYRFEPGSIELLCPACCTVLPGCGFDGNFLDSRVTCPGCKTTYAVDEVMVRPCVDGAVGVLEDRTGTARAPFESFRHWWEVCRQSMTAPESLLQHRVHRKTDDALGFAILTVFLAAAICGAIVGLIGLVGTLESRGGMHVLSVLLSVPFLLIGTALAAGIGVVMGAGLLAASAHLVLLVTASRRRSFRYTFRTACYACGPLIVAALPVIGAVVAIPWGLLAFMAGLRAVHQVSTPIALIAAFWLPAVVMTLVFLP